jgi:hypothetical protein
MFLDMGNGPLGTNQARDGGARLRYELIALGPLCPVSPRNAIAYVVLEQTHRNAFERAVGGRDLGQDVDAVAVLFNHALQAPDLALDPSQPL